MFDDVFKAAEAVRVISQAWLFPANVRLLDSREAFNNGFGDRQRSVVVLAFENADHPVDAWMDRALAITKDFVGNSIAMMQRAAADTAPVQPRPGATPLSACRTT
ncbi:hypothetical protein [Bradyrhizobium sp. CCGUVB23]|uniref:hypothetical protein n=1 Tax=Bradyrhizobium sp. CCGUVB23 TaxID=2949630 RepID=UPI0020B26584|nr:hypothetical protein [Bradyrhizobium sp. CCGUVB23]MCP3468429.1 hypothetical protein [Bradyrhizobium sp. CCGUVB23]